MRLSLRLMGLDVLDLNIETDAPTFEVEALDEGSCTSYPVGFSTPEMPTEFEVPDRWEGD